MKMIKKFNKKTSKYMDNPEYKDNFPDKPYGEKEVKDHINTKAMKDLPHSSYSIKADPYTANLPTSTPYNILAPFLRTVGGQYDGEDNIDGGNVKQYANSSATKFLNYFDSFRMKVMLNYRYLPITKFGDDRDRVGKKLIDEMRKSIAEAISVLQSTTYTNLAVNNFAVVTNMNMGSAETVNIGTEANPINAYTDQTDVMYAISVYYQLVLQEALSVMNAHNSFRLKEGTAIRDAWGREVPILNSFFGLMNKASFLNLLDSINLSFEGEYVDSDFASQVNMLTVMPSRRSNSLTDPVLEIEGIFDHPSIFKIYTITDGVADSTTPFYDDSNFGTNITVGGSTNFWSFWDACAALKDKLTLESVKAWARGVYTPDRNLSGTDNAQFNMIKALFDVITQSFVIFKPAFSDYRQCLDTMARTGTLSWTKGFRPSVTKDTDAQLFQNLIINDIYRMVMSGNDSLSYNDATKRWETFTQWDIYTGVPEYDTKQGGAFITFSAKELGELPSNEEVEYLPIMFTPIEDADGAIIYGVNRKGTKVRLTYSPVTMSANPVLERLAPLQSQNSLKIRVPLVSYDLNHKADGSEILTSADKSTLYKVLTQIFGLAAIEFVTATEVGDVITYEVTSTDYAADPDILAVYQIEIEDVSNVAITYARANAPFRGTTSNQGILGFFGLKR